IGNIFAALVTSIARNPATQNQIQTPALLGFALAEATGLFGLIIAFMILFVFRSEERRVGKECRSRWAQARGKKKSGRGGGTHGVRSDVEAGRRRGGHREVC